MKELFANPKLVGSMKNFLSDYKLGSWIIQPE